MTEKTEAPELSAQEKLQIEYNQAVGLYGHNLMQIKALQDETDERVFTLEQQNKDLTAKLQKILRKAKNIQKTEPAKEETTVEGMKNVG